jgi:ParB-like chromosome segregation protein Spo0J
MANNNSRHPTTEILIRDIKIGKRFRRDSGNLESLKDSIRAVGLLHPLVITPNKELVCGWRRLLACKSLGQDTVAVRVIDLAEVLRAEQDENTVRKDFLPMERTAIAMAIEEVERVKAKGRHKEGSKTGGKIAGRGRPKKGSVNLTEPKPNGSDHKRAPEAEDIAAKAAGMSKNTYRKLKVIKEAAERDPEKYGDLPEKVDETGKVDKAFKEFQQRANPPRYPHSDLIISWLKMVSGQDSVIRHQKGGLQKLLSERGKWSWSLVNTMILPMLDSLISTIELYRKEIGNAAKSEQKKK